MKYSINDSRMVKCRVRGIANPEKELEKILNNGSYGFFIVDGGEKRQTVSPRVDRLRQLHKPLRVRRVRAGAGTPAPDAATGFDQADARLAGLLRVGGLPN